MVRNDPLWKGIIQELVFPFLLFFYPEEEFDLSQEPEFLDKELEQIFPREDTDAKRRLVDKLIKVWTISGEEKWILIHIEVQGYRDPLLPQRMFQCFYRILDSHKKPVISLVIYTDSDPGYKPATYHYEMAGTKLSYTFGTYKILEQSTEELEKSDNPFALVILTVLESLKMKDKAGEKQIDSKLKLVRHLIGKNYDRKYIRGMMSFIRFYVRLPDDELNLKFDKKVEELVTNKNIPMGVEEILIEQAKEEGLEKGLQKGRDEGREEQLYEVVKRMLIKGKGIQEICDLLEVSEAYVLNIQKEILG